MKIDLTEFFSGIAVKKKIDCVVDLSGLSYCGYFPVRNGAEVSGILASKADVVSLDLKINFTFFGVCDRCAEDLKKDFTLYIDRIVVGRLENEQDDEEYIVVPDGVLDIDRLVGEEVSLSFPSKLLCSEDCKGLCPKCGANLNVKKCSCKADVDPRMAALLQLLDE